jgi:hypothetical protein
MCPRVSVPDFFDLHFEDDFIPDLLLQHITPERYEELSSKFKTPKENERKLRPESFDFLTKNEKEKIEQLYMEKEANDISGSYKLEYYTIKAPGGKKLTFEISIGDSGDPFDLKTPYDERDGRFTDLSRSFIVEDF